ncbi:MAG: hypothetical protein RL318_178 [Fibrobacterota bacterium]|jgi:hypothetical protein
MQSLKHLLMPALFLASAMAHAAINAPARIQAESTKVSITAIHSQHRNWLQVQVSPVGACQEVVVDSFRVLDERIRTFQRCGDTTSDIVRLCEDFTFELGGVPHRDLQVAWHLAAMDSSRRCGAVKASRHLLEIPAPRKSPATDTLLVPWVIGRIDAIGPNGQRDTLDAFRVDQSGSLLGLPCPAYSVMCPSEIGFIGPDSLMAFRRDSVLETLRQRVVAGQTLVRVGATVVNQGIRKEVPFGGLVLLIPWNAGNQAYTVSHPFQVRRSWGPVQMRETLARETGERIELWRNSMREPIGDTLSSSGMDLELSNDSTHLCDWLKMPDQKLASDLAKNDWLLFLDTAEARTGMLTATFKRDRCGFRANALEILNDSVWMGGVRIPMALLDQALGVSPSSRRAPTLKVSTVASGVRVARLSNLTEPVAVRVRTISGRLVTQATMLSSDLVIPLSGHGVFLVEAESPEGIARVRVVR